jgi:hypothetical protein
MPKTVRAILGDIYDAWRAQNLDWMATYLPDDFCHVIHIPADLHPLGGTRQGKKEALERLRPLWSSSISWCSTRATC